MLVTLPTAAVQSANGQAGSIVGWGWRIVVPQDEQTNCTAIAGGCAHSMILKQDGSIVAWGRNTDGQTNVPAPNSGFVAVAGGGLYSMGLKSSEPQCAPADLNWDGAVDVQDLLILLSAWRPCPE